MVISSKFRMRQNGDDDHREDTPHFTMTHKNESCVWLKQSWISFDSLKTGLSNDLSSNQCHKRFRNIIIFSTDWNYKVGCVFAMVVVSILPHAEFGRNDQHREEAPHFSLFSLKNQRKNKDFFGLIRSPGLENSTKFRDQNKWSDKSWCDKRFWSRIRNEFYCFERFWRRYWI